ncbi:MAG: DegV family protein [Bacillota bacterium]
MGKLHIVTDSTCDLPPELVKRHGLTVVPLAVRFGEEVYREGVEISVAEFYARMRDIKPLPATSQPTAGDFLEVYRKLTASGDQVLSIHISGDISGTLNSALTAKEQLPGAAITILDSRFASTGLGNLVLEAAEQAAMGKPLPAILERLHKVIPRQLAYFVVDDLEHLKRGGRIGAAQAALGSLLQLKPVLVFKDGRIALQEKIRTKRKALERIVELFAERVGDKPARVAVAHADAAEEGQAFLKTMRDRFPKADFIFAQFGAVIGTHVGPGTIGIMFHDA